VYEASNVSAVERLIIIIPATAGRKVRRVRAVSQGSPLIHIKTPVGPRVYGHGRLSGGDAGESRAAFTGLLRSAGRSRSL